MNCVESQCFPGEEALTFFYLYLFIFDCAGFSVLCSLSPAAAIRGSSLAAACGPIAVASPVMEHRLQARGLQ